MRPTPVCRQDELSRVRAIVDRPADVVPDLRLDLPLIQKARRRTVEHERRIDRNRLSRIRIDVEQDLARRDLPGGGSLPAPLRPLDHNGADGAETSGELAIYNPRLIANGENAEIVAGRMQRL
jgi:hypothetical protein